MTLLLRLLRNSVTKSVTQCSFYATIPSCNFFVTNSCMCFSQVFEHRPTTPSKQINDKMTLLAHLRMYHRRPRKRRSSRPPSSKLNTDLDASESSEEVLRLFKQYYKLIQPTDIVTALRKLTNIQQGGSGRAITKDERFSLIRQATNEQLDKFTPPELYLTFRWYSELGDDCTSELHQDILIKLSETCTLLSMKTLIKCIHMFNEFHKTHDSPAMKSLSLRFYRQLANKINWDSGEIEKLDDDGLNMLAVISEPLREKVKVTK